LVIVSAIKGSKILIFTATVAPYVNLKVSQQILDKGNKRPSFLFLE